MQDNRLVCDLSHDIITFPLAILFDTFPFVKAPFHTCLDKREREEKGPFIFSFLMTDAIEATIIIQIGNTSCFITLSLAIAISILLVLFILFI